MKDQIFKFEFDSLFGFSESPAVVSTIILVLSKGGAHFPSIAWLLGQISPYTKSNNYFSTWVIQVIETLPTLDSKKN